MARRRRNDPFTGFIILIAIVIGGLVWLKENVLDQIDPSVWVALAAILLFSVAARIWNGHRRRQREEAEEQRLTAEALVQEQESRRQRVEYMAWGVEKAVSIAVHQKWVSPHRLKTQIHVTDKQASELLQWGEAAGVLQQEVNGRYYATTKAFQLQAKSIE